MTCPVSNEMGLSRVLVDNAKRGRNVAPKLCRGATRQGNISVARRSFLQKRAPCADGPRRISVDFGSRGTIFHNHGTWGQCFETSILGSANASVR